MVYIFILGYLVVIVPIGGLGIFLSGTTDARKVLITNRCKRVGM